MKPRIARLIVVATTLLAVSAFAQPAVEVVATGLHNPRGLAFAPNGTLYVAEAGIGGPETADNFCYVTAEEKHCYGPTGSLSRIVDGTVERVVTGLPSSAPEGGNSAVGPHDVSFLGTGGAYVVIGLGSNPAVRTTLGPQGPLFGTAIKVAASGQWKVVTDVSAHESAANPDGNAVDSNPYSLVALPGGLAVVDAGANALIGVHANGKTGTIAVFPNRMVPAPPFLGLPPGAQIPMQAVPDSVTLGPDGALYVGQLTGFPFPLGGANVYRIGKDGTPHVFASGFTNIIDIAFDSKGYLWVLEIFTNSLLSGNPAGAVKRVSPDGSTTETILDTGLITPAGLAVAKDDSLYISNCGTCASGGEILHVVP